MAYNNLISRTSAQATIPEQVSEAIMKSVQNDAAALQMFTHIPMSSNQTRMPILSALPTAYFVNGDTGLKQTTQVDWSNKYLNAEEIAAIVPIPEAVLDDARDTGFDVWGSIMPLVSQAIARTLDGAVFFGVNKPASWPGAVVTDAASAGNTVARGANLAAAGGIVGDFSDLFATVEADGFDVDGLIASTGYKSRLRNARGTTGDSFDDAFANELRSITKYPMRGLWPTGAGSVEAVAGDFSQAILGVRQDITYKVLDQSVIQDNTGAIIYNLAQQDMVALRVVARFGFQIANYLNYDQPTTAQRYPFAVLHS